MSNPKSYPENMTDAQAELLLSWIPPAKLGGRPREVDIRRVINVIFYVFCTGVLGHGFLMIPPKRNGLRLFSKMDKRGNLDKNS